MLLNYEIRKAKEKTYRWFVWKLPRELIMWCAVRLMAFATQGQYGKESPDDVSVMDALKRWEAT